jgi:hypothetical protein
MNDDVVALLSAAVERVEQHIRADEYPAVVAVDGQRTLMLSDYDYLRSRAVAAAFERRAATHARRVAATRWVLAVPQVWMINERDVGVRAVSPHPLREGEQEAITWMAFDQTDGVDYGRVPYTRRPNGEPVFGEPEMFTAPVLAGELMPGNTLPRSLIDNDESTNSP